MALATRFTIAVYTDHNSKLQHNNRTYHVGVKRRRELLSVQFFPVDGGEEHVVLDLVLKKATNKKKKKHK